MIVIQSTTISPIKSYNNYNLMETLVVIQSATVVEVDSGSTSTTITTVADTTKVNGNIDRRLSATKKCHMIANIAIQPATCN